MPPYGTAPHPYVAMYPHGGLYAHPSMPPVFLLSFSFFVNLLLDKALTLKPIVNLTRDHILIIHMQCPLQAVFLRLL